MWVLGISILLHISHCLLLHFADRIFLFDRYNEGICKTSYDIFSQKCKFRFSIHHESVFIELGCE